MDNRIVIKEWRDQEGYWSYEKELAHRWEQCPEHEKQRIIKYMKLLKWYKQDPSKISHKNKKWILQNCDCETDIVPVDISNKYRLY